ncbi:hypothetical protein CORC01_12155 [Colletotrichum orchidophilum]|uniref:BZIP domain-containing protein n=1 Tax=Colletotrichum orchidophilum TaxID=1209926 RepID=A0A1G4AU01_9PEZI|nr:uncharacterized protein CORC01_12155 [Colletotrichum orchidophilum]OHE92576.1 hypothetical protein CORC01_12155 [Colletotrichum orchidophilum]
MSSGEIFPHSEETTVMDMCFSPGPAIPVGTTIPVIANPRLAELRDPSEDWTGVTSTTERRKLQNRLNQRARRRRAQKKVGKHFPSDIGPAPEVDSDPSKSLVKKESRSPTTENTQTALAAITTGKNEGTANICLLGRQGTPAMLEKFAEEAYADYMLGRPCTDYLTTLVRVNVFHAFVRNARALNFNAEWLTYDSISPFNKIGPGLGPAAATETCPPNMLPTALQMSVEHHPWIDFFPHARMRDNFLRIVAEHGEDYVDEDEICRDVVDVGAGAGVEHAALIVWGEPWDPRGWEATEPFLRKWGWLLAGCTEMLEGTNYWREKRGLRKLKFT